MNVATAIAQVLAEHGTRSIFGVPASETMATVVAAADAGIATYHARHEQGAVAMADGYARFSSQPGVVVVGRGPGFTNGLNALLTAVKARTPLVVLTGALPTTAQGEDGDRHVLHMKNVDQEGIARLAGCDTVTITDPRTARAAVRAALARASHGRTVVLLLPTDVARAEAPPDQAAPSSGYPGWPADGQEQPVPPASAAIDAVADLLQEQWACRRPLILAGRGAIAPAARDGMLALGDLIGAVLVTSLPAKGLFTGHDADAGVLGTLATPTCSELATKSDLILAFGASLNPFTTYGGDLVSGARLVHFDADSRSIGRHAAIELAVVGDAAASAGLLVEELRRRGHRAPGYRTAKVLAELRRARTRAPAAVADGGRLDLRAALGALDSVLPKSRLLVIDAGAHMPVAASSLSVPGPQSFVTTATDYTSVGSAYGVAMGAAIARTEVTTVLVIGDGGLAMALPDLQTAARYRLPLVVVVCNDAAFGQELQLLQLAGLPGEIARYPEFSFAAIARDVGLDGITVSVMDDLGSVAEAIRQRRLPLVVDCKVATGMAGPHSALVSRLGR